ncbi:MAG: sulfite exporter TauE/SafE family protein [Chloroflexi bacterium]|nr:sulfite exporter TauE/SafE family protein [Chloroflexota bacterium]
MTSPQADLASDWYRTEVPILGMTCRSCEIRVARYLGKLKGVDDVEVSAPRHRAVIASSRPLPYRTLERAVRLAGYEIGETPWLERDLRIWGTAAAGVAIVAVLALLAQLTGLSRLTSGVGDLSKGGIVVALLLGLAAGVSTCMALVGGLVLALSASFQASSSTPRTGLAAMRPAAIFLTGRIAGYAFFGAVLGALGASITMPPLLTGVLMLVVAVTMTILGTRLTGLSPRIAGWSPTLPMGVGRSLGLGGGNHGGYSDTRAAGLGAASFFLPCGFTQAVQIFALSTGSPLFGAALLGTFALGTAPGLFALAGLPVVVPSGARPTLLRLVGVVVLGFAALNANAGMQLAGLSLPGFGVGSAAAADLSSTVTTDGRQLLTTYQGAEGYSPSNVTIYAGIPTEWTIQSSTVTTCAATLVVPAWGTGANLKLGPNVFDLPALQPGVIHYTCAMGMYSGSITVIDRPVSAAPSAGN